MYQSYNSIPYYSNSSFPANRSNYSSSSQDNRLIGGGFLGPFILGGITGGLIAPAFGGYGYGRRPYYNNNYYYYPYPPYPYYYR